MHAYSSGIFGMEPNEASSTAIVCPVLDAETSASMSIKINCGFDIERDAWGHAAGDEAGAELETCIRMAWSWVRGRVGDQYIEPWAGLCEEDGEGSLRCRRDRFHLEGADD